MSEWQKIETAPRDGTPILAYLAFEDEPVFDIIKWDGKPKYPWRYVNNNAFHALVSEDIPTHWQPLPAPPEGE